MTVYRNFLLLSAVAMPLAAPAAVAAQTTRAEPQPAADQTSDGKEPGGATADDIVVTATRRNESLLSVPVSVAAYSQETLDTKSVKSIADIARITPGVTVNPGFNGTTNINIRGIASQIGAGTTGIYINDTPIQVRELGASASSTNPYPAIFDLARVEVLRGPQGTLFGAGSEGGSVRFITPDPDLQGISGYARGELSFTEHGEPSFEIGAAIGGAVVEDRIGVRASFFHRRDGGYVDHVTYPGRTAFDKDTNTRETIVGQVAVTLAPTERLKFTPSVYYQSIARDDLDELTTLTATPAVNGYVNFLPQRSPGRDRFALYSGKIDLDLGGVNLFSNTSYLDRRGLAVRDYSTIIPELLSSSFDFGISRGFIATSSTIPRQQAFTQEVRLQSADEPHARFKWVAGVFYQTSRQNAVQTVTYPTLEAFTRARFGLPAARVLGSGALPGDVVYRGSDYAKDEQIAAFGQIEISPFEAVTIIAGARVARTRFTFSNEQIGPFNGGVSGGSGSKKETPFTPKIGVQFRPSDDFQLYATAAKGFRTGGANTPVSPVRCAADLGSLGLTGSPPTYEADSVWSYEVGTKGRVGRGVQFAGSVYQIDWSDIQNSVGLRRCGFGFVANLGSARSRGFDAQVTVRPVAGLTLDAGVSYTDARYRQTVLGAALANGTRPALVTAGQRLNTAPWNVSLAGDYETAMGGDLRGFLHLDYQYRSSVNFTNPANASYDPLLGFVDRTDFAAGRLGIRRRGMDLSVFVQNIFNADDVLNRRRQTLTTNLLLVQTYRPRTIGVALSHPF